MPYAPADGVLEGMGTPVKARIGALLWIFGAAQFFVAHIVTELSWPTPYSWAGNNISDLGNVSCRIWDDTRPRYVCSPLHQLFNTAVVIEAVCIIAGIVLAGFLFGRGILAMTGRILLISAACGYLLVALKPADVDENLHLLGALVIMGCGNLGFLLAAWPNRLRVLTAATGVTAIVAAVLFFHQIDPGIGLGGMERVAVFALQVWTVAAGFTLLLKQSWAADRRTRRESGRPSPLPPGPAGAPAPGSTGSQTAHAAPK
jgi:hypothetical membrane protein